MPTIAVSAYEQLLPSADRLLRVDLGVELFDRHRSDDASILFRARRVSEWLVHQVASVTYQLPQQSETTIRPVVVCGWLGHSSHDRDPVISAKFADFAPSAEPVESVFAGGA